MNTAPAVPRGKKILLVVGNVSRRNLRANIFRNAGIEVVCAAHISEARLLWHASVFDLVLLDMRMHSSDAVDFCKQIKSDSPRQGIAWLVGKPEFVSHEPLFDRSMMEDSVPLADSLRQRMAEACEALPHRGGFLEARWRMALQRSSCGDTAPARPTRTYEVRLPVAPKAKEADSFFSDAVLRAEAEQEGGE